MSYNPKYVLPHRIRIKKIRFYFIVLLPVICFSNTTGVSSKLKQNNLQTASRIHLCTFLTIFQSHLSCLSLTLFSNPKNKVLYSYSNSRCQFIQTASAIQYKSRNKYRTMVSPIRTRIQFLAILFGKMETFFGTQANISKQFHYREVSALSFWYVWLAAMHAVSIWWWWLILNSMPLAMKSILWEAKGGVAAPGLQNVITSQFIS